MKTLLIIINIAGGAPASIDYPTAPQCEAAKVVLEKEVSTQLHWIVRAACIPAPTEP